MKNMSFDSQKPDLYNYENITFTHRVINAQWHAKFGFRFLDTLTKYVYPLRKFPIGIPIGKIPIRISDKIPTGIPI